MSVRRRNDLAKRKYCYRIGTRGVLPGTVVADLTTAEGRGTLVKYDWKVLRTLSKRWRYSIISSRCSGSWLTA